MKAVRRFGLIIGFLLVGLLIGKLGSLATIVVFSGLFIVWFMLWDEKKYAQKYEQEEDYWEDDYYDNGEPEEVYYIDSYDYYDHHYHKSA
ncbi:hypothetical protein [Candidatus Enterococcus ferrettii]|uniref:DUF2273 domain-containing protein n=1 Tax=Candidatus Enterococcus ferrettii TaxID=2815324 RepID=A0ABV0EP96_9ENTE|nr:hypothetical protein [Enterococcus sp. 665A]MBO1340757.1 hypothetical protein [Enterococcus sp. 665A]